MPKLVIAAPLANWWHGYQLAWVDCPRCPLAVSRYQVVCERGRIPADILFIGEAPGLSEDRIGFTFVGAAGKEMDSLLKRALVDDLKYVTYCITNTVACCPKAPEASGIRQPSKDEIDACSPRLRSLYRHVNPALVVFVGKVAKQVEHVSTVSFTNVTHPAWLTRLRGAKLDTERNRWVLTLQKAIRSTVPLPVIC